MNRWRGSTRVMVCLTAACLWVVPLIAQQEQGEKPKPAARETPPLFDTNREQRDTDQETQNVRPDNGSMSAVQNLSLGTPEVRHSYWVPWIEYSNAIRSDSVSPTAASVWDSSSFISVHLSLLES